MVCLFLDPHNPSCVTAAVCLLIQKVKEIKLGPKLFSNNTIPNNLRYTQYREQPIDLSPG